MTAPNGTDVTIRDGKLPDLNKPSTQIKFADMWSSGKLDKLTTDQQGIFLAALGNHIGLKAELGDLMLYQGKPYITISGYRRIAHNTGLLAGINPRPASEFERKRYGAKDGEHLWSCEVWKKGSGRPYVGWGHVRVNDKNPVTKTHPQEMAKKRAVYDGLRLAFPPAENIGDLHMQYAEKAEFEADEMRESKQIARTSSYEDLTDQSDPPPQAEMEAVDVDSDEVIARDDAQTAAHEKELEDAIMGRHRP